MSDYYRLLNLFDANWRTGSRPMFDELIEHRWNFVMYDKVMGSVIKYISRDDYESIFLFHTPDPITKWKTSSQAKKWIEQMTQEYIQTIVKEHFNVASNDCSSCR